MKRIRKESINPYCRVYYWLKTGFRLVIEFINHLQVVTTTKYNTVTHFHTTNHSTLIFSVHLHQSSLYVSWQRIYNTLAVNKSSNHTLTLHRPTSNSDLRRLNSPILSPVWSTPSYRLSLYRLRTDRIENTTSDVLLRRNIYRAVA
jgi:hypothetical protein